MDDAAPNVDAAQTPPERRYQVTLKGEGITVDREIGEGVALQVLSTLMAGTSVGRAARGGVSTPRIGAKPNAAAVGGMSLREFFDEVEPKRNVEKIAAIAVYVVDELSTDPFTVEDIKKQFRSASEPLPGNWARDWRWTVSTGWIAPVPDEPGEFYVTDKGRKAVTAKFSSEVKKGTGVGRSRRRRARKAGGD